MRDGDYVVSLNGRPVGATLSGWCSAARGVRSGQVADVGLYEPISGRSSVRVRFE
jgi:hypothetical protein